MRQEKRNNTEMFLFKTKNAVVFFVLVKLARWSSCKPEKCKKFNKRQPRTLEYNYKESNQSNRIFGYFFSILLMWSNYRRQ